ncbi:MAG: chromate resistance protein [Candidatus Eremiobacteraeota bacterium]|nr:chromate resistance protein [Candidatus Eremiobacteraeota bacterium]
MTLSFITREHAKVDRIACAWLIRRFIDPEAEILYVPRDDVLRVAETTPALPFDVPGVELGHHGELCSFDAFLKKYKLSDPALARVAEIVRGADTENRALTPESAGLYAIASGFHAHWGSRYADDHALLDVEFPLYDALYEFCKHDVG